MNKLLERFLASITEVVTSTIFYIIMGLILLYIMPFYIKLLIIAFIAYKVYKLAKIQ